MISIQHPTIPNDTYPPKSFPKRNEKAALRLRPWSSLTVLGFNHQVLATTLDHVQSENRICSVFVRIS
jgi:hypothetical protein